MNNPIAFVIFPTRLLVVLLLSWLRCGQVMGDDDVALKPLPRYAHYYPDAQYHLPRSDDRPEMKGRQEQCCVQHDPNGFDLAFIEFDQRGDFWNRRQLAIAASQLKMRTAGKKPLLIEYIHGWHHNAQEDPGRDVAGFRRLLAYLSQSKFVEDNGCQVFGVYLGWRGEQFRSGKDLIGRINWIPSALSFYSSQHIGDQVGTMPMISEALFWMIHEARICSPSARTILIGHSFGAMVLENAIAQSVVSSVAMSGSNSVAAPADLVLLLNSAANSLRAKGLTEMLDRIGPTAPQILTDHDTPLIVSVTSTGDWATATPYHIGTSLANLTKRFRSYDVIGHNSPLPPDTSQRYFITHTPGHNELLLSSTVEIDSKRIAPSTRTIPAPKIYRGVGRENSQSIFDDNLCYPMKPETDQFGNVWPFRSLARNGGCCISKIHHVPHAKMSTAYWIMNVPPQIIYDHGDIFNEQALCLYSALFNIENAMGKPSRPGPRMLQIASRDGSPVH